MKIEQSYLLNAPIKLVGAAVCSEEFNIELDELREDVFSSRFQMLDKKTKELSFEIYSTEYFRTKMGKIDKSRQKECRTVYTWTPATNTLHWIYRDPTMKQIHLSCDVQLQTVGKQTKIDRTITVEVKIPIIGRQIAKMIANSIEEGLDDHQRLLAQYSSAK